MGGNSRLRSTAAATGHGIHFFFLIGSTQSNAEEAPGQQPTLVWMRIKKNLCTVSKSRHLSVATTKFLKIKIKQKHTVQVLDQKPRDFTTGHKSCLFTCGKFFPSMK